LQWVTSKKLAHMTRTPLFIGLLMVVLCWLSTGCVRQYTTKHIVNQTDTLKTNKADDKPRHRFTFSDLNPMISFSEMYPQSRLPTKHRFPADSLRAWRQQNRIKKRYVSAGVQWLSLPFGTAEGSLEYRPIPALGLRVGGGYSWAAGLAYTYLQDDGISDRHTSGQFVRADLRLYPVSLFSGYVRSRAELSVGVGLLRADFQQSASIYDFNNPTAPPRLATDAGTIWGLPVTVGHLQHLGRHWQLEGATQVTFSLNQQREYLNTFIPGAGIGFRLLGSVHYRF
jgi:hypothetical protein